MHQTASVPPTDSIEATPDRPMNKTNAQQQPYQARPRFEFARALPALLSWAVIAMLATVPALPAHGQSALVQCPVQPIPIDPLPVDIDGFLRGDCNGDGGVDIADIIQLLSHLFGGGTPLPCDSGCDFNDDGQLDIADAIAGLAHLFSATGPLPEPFNVCGIDPTPDSLPCATPACQLPGSIPDRRAFTLATGRVGVDYVGMMPHDFQRPIRVISVMPNITIQPRIGLTQYGVNTGSSLPPGLSLDSSTGIVTGIPLLEGFYDFEVWATTAGNHLALYSVHLAIFTPTEMEIDPNPTLSPPPGSVNITDSSSFAYTHDLPWPIPYPLWDPALGVPNGTCPGVNAPPVASQTVTKQLRIYDPVAFVGPLPLVIFHHGSGYAYDDYDNILRSLAAQGALCVAVNDTYSFQEYPAFYCWGGHDEAARVMIAAKNYIISAVECPSEPLFGRVDPENIFYAGHSRGGAAAIVAAEFDHNTRGVIALQPTDARSDAFIGNTNRWVALPRVPILNISVEQDIDVGFPASERIFERFRGASTMVTIFGGCHGLTTNSSTSGCDNCVWAMVPILVDNCPYIDRTVQQQIINNHTGAFIRRHAYGEVALEGFLYGANNQFSPQLSHAHKRDFGGAIVVDDFSNFPTNSLGFATNSTPSLAYSIGACYEFRSGTPAVPPVAIDNLLVDIPAIGTTLHTSPIGTVATPLNLTTHRYLSFRIKNPDTPGQIDNFGFSWLDEFRASLTDGAGNTANVNILAWLPNIAFHPQPTPPGAVNLKYQRFMTVSVPLSAFTTSNAALDLADTVVLELRFSTVPNPTDSILAIDEIHFE
ncbi:MAG: putative Ig domain-containing protein [Planctomycetota bacterium]